jgi:hypothetical protein|tara:strand:+ start:137 stop:277 length:141 start_codon:yes stop_codon:yes gene_type:complete
MHLLRDLVGYRGSRLGIASERLKVAGNATFLLTVAVTPFLGKLQIN